MDTIRCSSCPNNTYPFLHTCLPCKNFVYNYYESNTYLTKCYYTQVQNYCLREDIFFNKQQPKIAFQIKFNSQSIDSYYFRSELRTAIYFCKVREESKICE